MSIRAIALLVAPLLLLPGCAVELAHSSDVPADEIRQQYEVNYDESKNETSVRAYFLRNPKHRAIEQQLILRDGSSIRVNGKALEEVVCDLDQKHCDKAYYQRTFPTLLKEVAFDFVAPDGKHYRNKVTLPGVKVLTDLRKPIRRGLPFTLRFELPGGAEHDADLAGLFNNIGFLSPEKEPLDTSMLGGLTAEERGKELADRIGFGELAKEKNAIVFAATETAKLKPGKAYLFANFQLRMPLAEKSPAEGSFLRVRYRRPPIEVEIANP